MHDARVLVFAGHLEGEPCPNRVQRVGEEDGGQSGSGAGDEFVGVLDVHVGGQDGGEVLWAIDWDNIFFIIYGKLIINLIQF